MKKKKTYQTYYGAWQLNTQHSPTCTTKKGEGGLLCRNPILRASVKRRLTLLKVRTWSPLGLPQL